MKEKVLAPRCGCVYHASRVIARIVYRFRGGRVLFTERVPLDKAVIIAPNHASNLDPPFIHAAIPRKCVANMAKKELFKGIGAWLMPRLYSFPVDRERADLGAIKEALATLKRGHGLLMFPEGARSKDGSLQPPQDGVSVLALKTQAPIVPTFIAGTGANGKKGRPVIIFGDPFFAADFIKKEMSRDKQIAVVSEKMMTEIKQLALVAEQYV